MLLTQLRNSLVQLGIPAIAVCALALVSTCFAQTETTLHNFIVKTGSLPAVGVTADGSGNLYGTTLTGGTGLVGVVYRLDAGGHYTVLHNFAGGADGTNPYSAVTRDSMGNLYGNAEEGGPANCGVVYKLDPGGQETILHSFTCKPDGQTPVAKLTLDAAGRLYGITVNGGAFAKGIVYRLDPDGQETVLYNFGGPDGRAPISEVTLDGAGNLFGITQSGGARDAGVIYKLDSSGQEAVLHSFSGGLDGAQPTGGLVRDASGNLYGTSYGGGASNVGVVYKLESSGDFTVLHSFAGSSTDGAYPRGTLTFDSFGNLYGTTTAGGASNAGAIFKIDAVTHQESLIYSFDFFDGSSPEGTLLIVGANIYGITYRGGTGGLGVLFKITPAQ